MGEFIPAHLLCWFTGDFRSGASSQRFTRQLVLDTNESKAVEATWKLRALFEWPWLVPNRILSRRYFNTMGSPASICSAKSLLVFSNNFSYVLSSPCFRCFNTSFIPSSMSDYLEPIAHQFDSPPMPPLIRSMQVVLAATRSPSNHSRWVTFRAHLAQMEGTLL